jgi:murein DD-endopeptidase MepM/ murein hydrolase activator NlpD
MKINNYKKFKVVIITIIAVIFLFTLWYFLKTNVNGQAQETEIEAVSTEPETKKIIIPINVGDTYGVIMEKEELRELNSEKLYAAAKEYYDLAQIRAGYSLELICDYQSGKAQELIYKIDGQEQLSIKIEGENYTATIMPIPYETRIVSKKGNISSSLYEAALEKEIDERAIIALADAFQWSIDFAMDPRVGDTFKFIYEEKYLDDEYIRPGKILAGKYVNSGKEYYVFYFDGEKDNEGYFDEEGNSVQKLFLKAPVAFKYISSGFTTGLRYVEAFNVSTGHRAIDYAAPSGTPIRSVGDGTITSAGWNGSYGYMVSVRHNGTYSTNYAHMSKMAVKKGAKVKQGDVIGYVGSTGFSTGPHLHYEMVKNGIKINPLTEVLPPGKSLNEEIKIIFLEKIKEYKEDLNKN